MAGGAFDKPVLIYWCQIASYKVFWRETNLPRVLPSALFCIGTRRCLLAPLGQKKIGR